jgi:group I intron endonuclease
MKSGIYKILNLTNNKIYVGSAVNLERRRKAHLNKLKHNSHPNYHLQNSYNLYGSGVFDFTVIEFVNIKQLIEREQYYIDVLNPEYNICPIAGNSLGRKHTKESIEKIKNNSLKRKTHPDTISALKIGRGWNKGLPFSKESREKMSIAKNKIKVPVVSIDGDGVEVCYESISLASKHGYHSGHIVECCKGNQKTHKGLRWIYGKR